MSHEDLEKANRKIREMEKAIREMAEDDTPADEITRAILVKEEHWDRLAAFLEEARMERRME